MTQPGPKVGPKPAAFKSPGAASAGEQRRRFEERRMKILADFIKLNPPKFEGLPKPFAAKTWLETVKEMFEKAHVSPKLRVGFAVYLFEGLAEEWLEMKEDQNCHVVSLDWAGFDRQFREMYIPDATLKKELLAELLKLGQGKMTVARYFSRFAELYGYDPAMATAPALRCERFREGLRPEIRARLAAYAFSDIDVLVDAAVCAEAAVGKRKLSTCKTCSGRKRGQYYCPPSLGHKKRKCSHMITKLPNYNNSTLVCVTNKKPEVFEYKNVPRQLQQASQNDVALTRQSNAELVSTSCDQNGDHEMVVIRKLLARLSDGNW